MVLYLVCEVGETDECQEMLASWDGGIRGLSVGIRGNLIYTIATSRFIIS